MPFDQPLHSWRYGHTTLKRGHFEKIIAKNTFQKIPNFKQALTNCLDLLSDGGTVEIVVPLDMSLDSWSGLDDCRAFNDKTWGRIIDDWWQYGWLSHRFEIAETGFGLHNEHGMRVLNDNGHNWDAAMRSPRAIDSMTVILRKRPLTSEESAQLPQVRFLD